VCRFALALALFAGLSAFAVVTRTWAAATADATRCLAVLQADIGTMCGSDQSLAVTLQNQCNSLINAQLCLVKIGGGFAVRGSNHNMRPNDTLYQYTCIGNGTYNYWGCTNTRSDSGNCGINGR
jgi:hypothetical protein